MLEKGRGMPVENSVSQQAARTWSTLALTDRQQTWLNTKHKKPHCDIQNAFLTYHRAESTH